MAILSGPQCVKLSSDSGLVPYGACRLLMIPVQWWYLETISVSIKMPRIKSCKILKLWDMYHEFPNCFEIWQAAQQQCCWAACHISKQYQHLISQFHGYEIQWVVTLWEIEAALWPLSCVLWCQQTGALSCESATNWSPLMPTHYDCSLLRLQDLWLVPFDASILSWLLSNAEYSLSISHGHCLPSDHNRHPIACPSG